MKKIENKLDYILPHTIDKISMMKPPLSLYRYTSFPTSEMLYYFETNVKYKHWYCGHFHEDIKITDKKTILYNKNIIMIE